MKYIITEDQYAFLKYGEKPRLDYMEQFQLEIQEIIDNNFDFLLEENNSNDYYNKILDLIVDDDIRLGIGNRGYDIKIWAVVDYNENKKYFINSRIIEYKIREFIREKYGFKTSVKIKLTLPPSD